MDEVNLTIIDWQGTITGVVLKAVVYRCIAALSAMPETILELNDACARFMKLGLADAKEWVLPNPHEEATQGDLPVSIIDLAARIVTAEESVRDGYVHYGGDDSAEVIHIPYRVPSDWLLVETGQAYKQVRERRLQERHPFFDARAILFGTPLLAFIQHAVATRPASTVTDEEIVGVHAKWLMTKRWDLQDRSPRDVLLEHQDFIDFDLHSRSLQWSLVGEGPPSLSKETHAFRFAGFGTHEWVVYYDLVRHLIKLAALPGLALDIGELEKAKTSWLETSNADYDGRTPAVIIENERRRLPEAMAPDQLIIDEDCECCRMMAQDAAMGGGPGFWHLDGSHMEDDFAFSYCKTEDEWRREMEQREASYGEFERQWAERFARSQEVQGIS